MDQTINEMEEKKYLNTIQETYDVLNKDIQVMPTTPVVPASKKLEANGVNLYIDEDGKLKCKCDHFAKSISKFVENKGLVKIKENSKESVSAKIDSLLNGLVQEF